MDCRFFTSYLDVVKRLGISETDMLIAVKKAYLIWKGEKE